MVARRCAALAFGVALGFGATVRADAPGTVEVAVVAAEPDRVAEEIDAVLSQAGFDVVTTTPRHLRLEEVLAVPAPPFSRARIFVEFADSEVLVIVADDQRGRLSIRRLGRVPDEDDILIEELVQIVSSSLGAIVAGAEFGLDRQTARARLLGTDEPEPEPADGGLVDVAAYLAYDLGFREGPSRLFHGPRLGVVIEVPPDVLRLLFFSDIAYRFGPGFRREDSATDGRIDHLALRLGAGLGVSSGVFRASLRVAAGLDIGVPVLDVPEPLVDLADVTVDPAVRIAAHVELAFGPDLGGFFEVGVEVFPVSVKLQVREGTNTRTISEPWLVQPSVALGLRVL